VHVLATSVTSRKLKSRAIAGLLAATFVALALAPSAGAATATGGTTPTYGGTSYAMRAYITGLQCLSNCSATSALALGTRPLSIPENSVLKVRGVRMTGVRLVVFTGRYGTADDVRVVPKAVGRLSVDVVVPSRANSGRIVTYSGPRLYSTPSRQYLTITRSPISPQGLIWPLASRLITSPFCERRSYESCHPGIDIATPEGTYLHASATGRVRIADSEGGYGNYICIAHATITTCYAHLSVISVTVGQLVQQNQIIGRSGCTGNCTGPHLHFETRTGTADWSPVANPLNYLPAGARYARASSSGSSPQDYDLPVYGT
jgi:murein DD-endopeptidase MepM/ murein hydrolase activator NlpD